MKKRNLLILSYDYPPSTGGVSRLCHEITLGLTSFYENIKVFTVAVPEVSTPHNIATAEITRFPAKRIQCEIETVKAIRKIKNKNSYDVLCGIWHPEVLLAFLGGMRNIYVLGHGAEFLPGASKFRKKFWLPIYAKWSLGKVKKVITNSHFTKNLVKKIQPKSIVKALPLAVDHIFFKPKEHQQKDTDNLVKFVTVSRILEFKGHDFILKTFEKLPKNIQSKIEWHIAGTGPFLAKLKILIEASPLKPQIYLHGFISDKELPNFYNTKDVFVLATREVKVSHQVEGFGLVFLEAQSSGVPAIGTNTGGISDAIEEGNGGWLFEQDNLEALQKIIISVVKNPLLIKEQATKARKRVVNKCTWNLYCADLYKTISG